MLMPMQEINQQSNRTIKKDYIDELARISHLQKKQAYRLVTKLNKVKNLAELNSFKHRLEFEHAQFGLNSQSVISAADLFLKVSFIALPFIGAYYWYLYQKDEISKSDSAQDTLLFTRYIGWIIPLVLGIFDLFAFGTRTILEHKRNMSLMSEQHFLDLYLPLIKNEIKVGDLFDESKLDLKKGDVYNEPNI